MSKVRTNIRVAAMADLAARMVKAFSTNASAKSDTILSATMASIEQQSAALITAINRSTAVSELDENDRLRDSAARGVFYLVTAYSFMEPYAKAAEKINAVLNRYGLKTLQEAYSEESSHLESLLEDLSASSLSETIKTLPVLEEAIATLRARQTAFNEVRVKYQSVLAQQSGEATAIDIRKQLVQLVNTRLLPYLSVLADADAAKYKAFAATVDTMINEANALIDQRSAPDVPAVSPAPSDGGE